MIRHNRYRLRKVQHSDAETLKGWWNDGRNMSYFGYPDGMGVDVEEVIKALENDKIINCNRLIIEADGRAVGECYFMPLDKKTAKIGIRICEHDLRNRGMGRTVLSMLISFLFDKMSFETVTVTTCLTNQRARHVYEKLGFKQNSCQPNQQKTPMEFVVYQMSKEDFVNFATE